MKTSKNSCTTTQKHYMRMAPIVITTLLLTALRFYYQHLSRHCLKHSRQTSPPITASSSYYIMLSIEFSSARGRLRLTKSSPRRYPTGAKRGGINRSRSPQPPLSGGKRDKLTPLLQKTRVRVIVAMMPFVSTLPTCKTEKKLKMFYPPPVA